MKKVFHIGLFKIEDIGSSSISVFSTEYRTEEDAYYELIKYKTEPLFLDCNFVIMPSYKFNKENK